MAANLNVRVYGSGGTSSNSPIAIFHFYVFHTVRITIMIYGLCYYIFGDVASGANDNDLKNRHFFRTRASRTSLGPFGLCSPTSAEQVNSLSIIPSPGASCTDCRPHDVQT